MRIAAKDAETKARSIDIGNAGEALVVAHLLAKRFHAAHCARNSPAFDILARKGDRYAALRVKSSRSRSVRFSAGLDGSVFPDLERGDRTDFVVFVLMIGGRVEESEFYIVPTSEVDKTLRANHAKYLSRGGKDTTIRALRFAGDSKNRSYGFDKRWGRYRQAWHLLEGPEREDR
jgi:hypothetical protein